MKRSLLLLAVLATALAFVATACGGGGSDAVPDGAVAVVDGAEVSRDELDQLMDQAKASYTAQDREFPQVGTPEHQSIQQQYVAFLVQKLQFQGVAEELEVEVTDAEVDKARANLLKDRFSGDEKKLADALEEQGLTEETLRETLRFSLLADELYKAVTKDVKVTDAEALAAYNQNQEQYRTPESRQVRHILVAEKDSNGQVDFAKSKTTADDLYGQLQDGADFAALVREHSADTGTKAQGGRYTANRGQSVPEFDKAAFELKTDEISRPVRTQYGYHIIQALEDAAAPKITPFDKVRAGLKATMLQERRSEVATKWAEDLKERYEGKVSYATGFAPPDLPDETETETETQ